VKGLYSNYNAHYVVVTNGDVIICFLNHKDYTASKRKIFMNDELRRILKKALMAYFKIPSQHSLKETEENNEKFRTENQMWELQI
jgi:hypothetical protein